MRLILILVLLSPTFYSLCLADTIKKEDEWPPTSAAYNSSAAQKGFDNADKKLNEVYQKIMSNSLLNTSDKVGKKLILESQHAWIKFRDINCEMYGEIKGGVPGWKYSYAMQCKEDMTKDRVKYLEFLLNDATATPNKRMQN